MKVTIETKITTEIECGQGPIEGRVYLAAAKHALKVISNALKAETTDIIFGEPDDPTAE